MTYLRTGLSLTATLTLSVATLAAPALGQEGSGRQGVLSFSQGFEFSDNPDLVTNPGGDSLISRTSLGLALSSETRVQRLSFSIGTEIVGDIFGETDDDFQFDNYTAELQYARAGANSELAFSASYRDVDLDDEVFDTGTEIIIDTGTVKSTRLGVDVRTGIEGPFGMDVSAGYFDKEYANTLDPDLIDSTTVNLDAVTYFRVAPNLAFRGLAGIEDIDEADGTQTSNTYVGVGVEGDTAGGLNFVGDILFDRSEVTGSPTEDGVGVELGVTQDRVNGTIGFELASRVDDAGRRSSVRVNRSYERPDGGLAFSLGVVDQEGDDSLRLIGGLDYTRETPRGGLTASLSQDAGTSDGMAVLNTGIAVSYAQDINSVSGWEASVEYFANNELGTSDDDNRAAATLAYTRDLTADWGMRTGVEHQRVSEAGGSARSSNTLFFSIERDITFGF